MKTESIGRSSNESGYGKGRTKISREHIKNKAALAKFGTALVLTGVTIVPAVVMMVSEDAGDDYIDLMADAGGKTTMLPEDSWPCISLALRNYIENRENGISNDAPDKPFPDGKASELEDATASNRELDWPDSKGRFKWILKLASGGREKGFFWRKNTNLGWPDSNGRYWFDVCNSNLGLTISGFSAERNSNPVQFDDAYCPQIREWMEQRDMNYLIRVKQEDPALFKKELIELKVANPNHPAIIKFEKEIKAIEQKLPFYEGKIDGISIAHLPFCLTTSASSSSSSEKSLYELEKVMTIGSELTQMGLDRVNDTVGALTTEFKLTRWENKISANQQIFYWLADVYTDTYVTSLFQMTLKRGDSPNIQLIAFMMHASKSVVMFKFPFTLISILWKEKDSDKEVLRQLIYLALKRIAEEQIVSDPESKCIAMFKLLLKSALKKGMINEVQFHQLDNMAEKTAIFSDERFLALKREIEILKQQFSSLDMRIGIAEKNLQLVADSVNELKYAFQQQKERKLYLSIATFGFSCFGVHALVDAITNVADLTDLAEIGSVVLKVPVEQSQSYLDGGLQALEQNKRALAQQGAGLALKSIGLDTDKFLETWMTANVVLQGSPQDKARLMAPAGSVPSTVSSSSSSSSSSASYSKPAEKTVSTPSSKLTQSGAPKPIVVNGYSAAAPSPVRVLPATPITGAQSGNQFFSAASTTANSSVYGSSSSSSSSSSSTINTQPSSAGFFAPPGAMDGIVLQEISENEFKVSIHYPKLRLLPKQIQDLQEVLTGADGEQAYAYLQDSSTKDKKGNIVSLSFEDKDSADILIAELNEKVQSWKSVSTPTRLVG